VHEYAADLFANLRTARLAGDDDVVVVLFEAGGDATDLGGLAAAFRAFECDEETARVVVVSHRGVGMGRA